MPLPLPKSAFYASRAIPRKNTPGEDAILGVVSGGGRVVQGASGLVADAAKYSQKQASLPVSETPLVRPPKTLSDIPRAVMDYMNTSSADRQTASRQFHRAIAPVVDKAQPLAEKQHAEAKRVADKIDATTGPTGKVTAFLAESVPTIALSEAKVAGSAIKTAVNGAQQVGLAIGKERNAAGGIVPAAAHALVKGNSLVKNMASQAIEAGVDKVGSLFYKKRKAP